MPVRTAHFTDDFAAPLAVFAIEALRLVLVLAGVAAIGVVFYGMSHP